MKTNPRFCATFLPRLVLSHQMLIMKENALGQQENIMLYVVNFLYVLTFFWIITQRKCSGFFHRASIFGSFFKQNILKILMLSCPCINKQFVQLSKFYLFTN